MSAPAPMHQVDLARLRTGRLAKLRAELARRDMAAMVLYDPINIRYATDASNMQVWCLHNPARYAFVATEGPVVLFEFKGCEPLFADFPTIDEVRPASSWFAFTAGSRIDEKAALWADEIAELLTAHGGGNRRLAFDRLDPEGAQALRAHGVELHEGQLLIEHVRARKMPEEIAAMRVAIATCEAGIGAMHERLAPGMSENVLWAELHRVNIEQGGEWIETRLLTSGPRTNPWYQECGPRVIEAGDLVSFDTDLIGPYGYCADISRSWLCGDDPPSEEQRTLYSIAHEQIAMGIAALVPGLSLREYTEAVGDVPAPYAEQRYSFRAHGVGLADEWPGIVHAQDFDAWGYEGRLEAGMTICVESYIGAPGEREGVKLEEQVLITPAGAEVLSTYPFEERLLA
jgi:Xaa-Pro dipeptidase